MKKEKGIVYFTIFCICIILTCIICMRFKSIEKVDLVSEQNLIESELRTEIANYKEKCNEAEEELQNVNNKINEYKEQIEKNETNTETITKELKQTSDLLGKTNVKGDGVIITLEDNEKEKILSNDLSELLNELKYAGAEAISINGIRIEALNDVSSTSENAIILNGQRITSPYIVKAIGNQTYLYSNLTAKNGYIDYYTKNYELSINIVRQRNIEIGKSLKSSNLKYIKEGEE